ncbi:ester cyclase [Dactylosporangium matsuzakiense]|uniref:Ester cyclase n=1 Tax=Dactylosporangium matsuzakiense TaxID=53360 RepID=A0A9W6KZ40_9ACTN|nr:ester cyclase [Dactylosporangium matsuzakiense]GLL08109.1 hypothetical protein GCM10017581_098690 [Dactylosporangium matsuzakiense]
MPTNAEIITRFEHAFRAGDATVIDELCDPGLVDHTAPPGSPSTLAGFKDKATTFAHAFPDLVEDLQDIVADGDMVTTRWLITGTLRHTLMGIRAAGQTIRVDGMNFYRLRDGRITDTWTQFDAPALTSQLTIPQQPE